MSSNLSLSPRWAALSVIMVVLAFLLAPGASPTPPDQKPNPGKGNGGGGGGGGQDPAPPGAPSDGGTGAQPSAAPSEAPSGPLERYIVVLKSGVGDPSAVAAEHGRRFGAQLSHVYGSALKGYAASIPATRVAAVQADANVEFLMPDGEVTIQEQMLGTGVNRINAQSKANVGAGVHVAVLDTGIDIDHPDLAGNVAGGKNCNGKDRTNYDDGHGHGTHVAGIIAALDNGIGVVGVAPQAKLWSVRVFNETGTGTWSDVICGINFVDSKSPARGGPIAVANMSLGGLGSDDGDCGRTNHDAVHRAICQAVADGVTFVVSAGNRGRDLSTFVPAAYDETIAVSALADSDGRPCGLGSSTSSGYDDTFASFSNYGTVDQSHLLAAPGVGIYSTYKDGAYATLSGTSMASPHAAGAVALYLSAHPGVGPAGVYGALKAVGEPAQVNLGGECETTTTKRKGQPQTRTSHTDPSLKHPEIVLRADSV